MRVDTFVRNGTFDQQKLAQKLGIQEFDTEESLSEKLGLPSSVLVQHKNDKRDKVIVRIKKGFDLGNPAFMEFLKKAYDSFPM